MISSQKQKYQMISSRKQNNRMISIRNQNNRMIHDLTARTGCINNQMIIYKSENEMHSQSIYLKI
jgi:ABC-type Mn2+/Zn2+ transport system ATPase subunit